tara:strand:+ start:1445 stop:1822 length:378 start_codon:yes stop_codon:yes gene_type:complete
MSHFSTIKTSIKHRPELVEALQLLQYNVREDVKLENPLDHEHKQWQVDVAVGDDIGFRWNGSEYELVTDLETWNQPIPPKRFVDKLTQQYARVTIHNTVADQGFEVQEEWEMDDNSIELTVTRWV